MTGRTYPPAVWWLPKRVRDALVYEQGMHGVAAQPVGEGGEAPIGVCVDEPDPQPVHAAPIKRMPPVAPTVPGQIFPEDTDHSSSARRFLAEDRGVVDEYHRSTTSGDGGGYWCRNPNCFHRAIAQGEPCPVCKDLGWKAISEDTWGGDAA